MQDDEIQAEPERSYLVALQPKGDFRIFAIGFLRGFVAGMIIAAVAWLVAYLTGNELISALTNSLVHPRR